MDIMQNKNPVFQQGLKIILTFPYSSVVTSSSKTSLIVSEAETSTFNWALTLEESLIVIKKLPTWLIGLSKIIDFLSISIPHFASNSSESFLVVIVPNNFPDSPALALNEIVSIFSISSLVANASWCNFSAFALILAIFLSLWAKAPGVATSAKEFGIR